MIDLPMSNPISPTVRGWLYVGSTVIGILAVIAGPLLIALDVSSEWSAVVVSAVGAVTTLLGTLARANLGDVATVEPLHAEEA